MTNDKESVPIQLEMEVCPPTFLKGPVQRADGTLFAEGDSVSHEDLGVGVVVRIGAYNSVGVCLYVEFESGQDEIIGIDFLEKLKNAS